MTGSLGFLVALGLSGGMLSSQADTTTTEVRWSPTVPVQGSMIRVTVKPRDGARADGLPLSISGSLAGQELHFEPGLDGQFHSLAGIPLGAAAKIPLSLRLEDGVWMERLDVNVPVARGEFSSTQLRVDPRFTTPPDSALALRLAAERDSVRAILAQTHRTPRLWNGDFLRPRTTRVTSDFGQRREFNGELRSRHYGTDLEGDVGAPVVAPNHGVVALVADFYYAGGLVYLDHGAGLLTAYLHLSQILVAVGDTVTRGQMIGRVGASGRVTGPHLHWIARYGSVMVDPLSLLDLDLAGWMVEREP
jgi:hypothetical protein